MPILAFDCAGAQCAVALVADGRPLAATRIESDRGHAAILVPMIQETLRQAGCSFGDLERIAVTTGPGSFTGIRVALATAQGLGLALDRPVVGVTVFDVVAAMAAHHQLPLLAAIDSRREELFLQQFSASGAPLGEPTMLTPDAIASWIGPGPVAIAGDATDRVLPALPGASDTGYRLVDPVWLAKLAGERPAGPAPAPYYLRPPDARPNPV